MNDPREYNVTLLLSDFGISFFKKYGWYFSIELGNRCLMWDDEDGFKYHRNWRGRKADA